MTRDVFLAAPSVLMCESAESLTFFDELECSQREVFTDSLGPVAFSFWQLTLALQGHLSDDCSTAVHANYLPVNCDFALRRRGSFWSWTTKRLMHAINGPPANMQFWVNSSRHMYPVNTDFFTSTLFIKRNWHGPGITLRDNWLCSLLIYFFISSYLFFNLTLKFPPSARELK